MFCLCYPLTSLHSHLSTTTTHPTCLYLSLSDSHFSCYTRDRWHASSCFASSHSLISLVVLSLEDCRLVCVFCLLSLSLFLFFLFFLSSISFNELCSISIVCSLCSVCCRVDILSLHHEYVLSTNRCTVPSTFWTQLFNHLFLSFFLSTGRSHPLNPSKQTKG